MEPTHVITELPDTRPSDAELRQSVVDVKESGKANLIRILTQIKHEAWLSYGYRDLPELWDNEYADIIVVVSRTERPELAMMLRRLGLPQTKIARAFAVSQPTVSSDLSSLSAADSEDQPPTVIVNSRGQERPAAYAPYAPRQSPPIVEPVDRVTGEVLDDNYTPTSREGSPFQDRPPAPVQRQAVEQWRHTQPQFRPEQQPAQQPQTRPGGPAQAGYRIPVSVEEQREADRIKSLGMTYTEIAEALETIAGYGQYLEPVKVMAHFDPELLSPPQLLSAFSRESREAISRFLAMLDEYIGD